MSEDKGLHLHAKPKESPKKLAIYVVVGIVAVLVIAFALASMSGPSKHAASVTPPAASQSVPSTSSGSGS